MLNSLSFLERSREVMEGYAHVHLYLDRDAAGIRSTLLAISWNSEKFTDQSKLYRGHKDLNEWLTRGSPRLKSNQKLSRRP